MIWLKLRIKCETCSWRSTRKARFGGRKKKSARRFELRSQRREIAREQDNLRRLLRESQRDLEERRRIAVTKVLKEIKDIVHAIGKQDGLDVIVDTTSGGVLFHNPGVDLTEKVIKLYDQKKK